MTREESTPRSGRSKQASLVFRLTFAVLVSILACVAYFLLTNSATIALMRYQPMEGDIVFQSLPHSKIVDAIEGATESPFSHCGIVTQKAGKWVVIEAIDTVHTTALEEFVKRGRGQAFAVYRLFKDFQHEVPGFINRANTYLGRPYDGHYTMDDEHIYCSELIHKAYRDASGGGQLGWLVSLGDLKWQPFEATIREIEPELPLDRELVTPRDVARSNQLELVYQFRMNIAK